MAPISPKIHIHYILYYMDQQVQTLRQFHEELKQSVSVLEKTLKEVGVRPLWHDEDFQRTKITVERAIEQIPAEEAISELLLDAPYKEDKQAKISMYSGDYELIKKAKENYSKLKKQQKDIYFLAAKIRIPEVSKEYMNPSVSSLLPLHSYKVMLSKYPKPKYVEKNTIAEKFSSKQDEKKQLLNIQEQQILQQNDLLITVSFYDSHNGRKQHEYVCLGGQKLSELVEAFYCMIQKLERNISKQTSFFVIGSNIYYQGNKHEIENFVQKTWTYEKVKYYIYEMKKVTFNDLRVVFGEVYLYRHLGGCDHMIVFQEARLFEIQNSYHDFVEKNNYPVITFQSKMKKKKCQGCGEKFANLGVISDPLKKGETSFLCYNCNDDVHSEDIKSIPYEHE